MKAKNTLDSAFITDKVYKLHYQRFDENTGAEMMYATIYLFEVGAEFATEHLANADVADIWLIQEDLDELISSRAKPGQWVGWIDCMEKVEDMQESATEVLAEFLNSKAIKLAFDICADSFVPELYLHPYPLNVFEEETAKQIQAKLIQTYSKKLGAIVGHKNLMIRTV